VKDDADDDGMTRSSVEVASGKQLQINEAIKLLLDHLVK
jgi:hypothetical protein